MTDSQVSEALPEQMLSPGEAAAMLGVTTTTLANWAARGHVESVTLPSGHRRYVAASVRQLVVRRGVA